MISLPTTGASPDRALMAFSADRRRMVATRMRDAPLIASPVVSHAKARKTEMRSVSPGPSKAHAAPMTLRHATGPKAAPSISRAACARRTRRIASSANWNDRYATSSSASHLRSAISGTAEARPALSRRVASRLSVRARSQLTAAGRAAREAAKRSTRSDATMGASANGAMNTVAAKSTIIAQASARAGREARNRAKSRSSTSSR